METIFGQVSSLAERKLEAMHLKTGFMQREPGSREVCIFIEIGSQHHQQKAGILQPCRAPNRFNSLGKEDPYWAAFLLLCLATSSWSLTPGLNFPSTSLKDTGQAFGFNGVIFWKLIW